MYVMITTTITAQTTSPNYFTNSDEAKAFASTHATKILMVFGGSDWCRPCIKLKKEVLDNKDFKDYTVDKLAVLYLDFPSKKKNKLSSEETKHNESLAKIYNKSGVFPKILLMDNEMNKLKEISYKGQSVADFISSL